MNHYLIIFGVIMLLQASCSSQQSNTSESTSGRVLEFVGTLDFLKSDNQVNSTIAIALADNDDTRSQGLMDVRTLNADQGMLFIFPSEIRQSFWMANTPLALDLIFVNENLEIVSIHQNARPFSRQSIDSEYPAKYVVEVNAGYAIRHDLQIGNKINYIIN